MTKSLNPNRAHAITPLASASSESLDGDASRVFDFIVRRFLQSVSPDAKIRHFSVRFTHEFSGEEFKLTSSSIERPGHLTLSQGMDMEDEDDEEYMKPLRRIRMPLYGFKEGKTYSISNVGVASRKTSPPNYLTEAELLSLMESV
jgi:DNA topoisomerase III